MAAVQNTQASKYTCRGLLEGEPPEHLESAGEALIRQLVQKQTNTHTTLDQVLKEEKAFERGVGFVSLNDLHVGTSSLQQFVEEKRLAERVGELEGKGLTKEEALAIIQGWRTSKAVPDAQEAEQKYIHQLLHKQTCTSPPLHSYNHDPVKRQDWEQALSVKPNSLETRLYHFAMKNTKTKPEVDLRPPEHPIHHLAALEQRLMQTADPQTTARTIRRKRRQQLEALAEPQRVKYKIPDRLHTLWDAIETPQLVSKKPDYLLKKATCKPQIMYTIREGQIVELGKEEKEVAKDCDRDWKSKPTGQAFISLESSDTVEVCAKLSEDEIRKLPRFQSYQRGNVSKVLYIKNLSDNVTETDLADVFDQFQEANERKIIFRLMTGKMRGQAFVTFANCDKATAALDAVNGSILRGKPMVVQYGRQQN